MFEVCPLLRALMKQPLEGAKNEKLLLWLYTHDKLLKNRLAACLRPKQYKIQKKTESEKKKDYYNMKIC